MANDAKRYFDKVDRRGTDECWPWLASRNLQGDCQVRWSGTTTRAAYVALELAGTPRHPDKLVKNTCGMDSCVNPRHLEQYTPPTTEERFSAMIGPETPSGCREWTGTRNKYGYGQFRSAPGSAGIIGAHRFAYELAHGPVPKGAVVMHSCDNRACVNSGHLSAGTPNENMADRNQKGRQAKGEKNHSAKLTEQQVKMMRQCFAGGMKTVDAARLFGVSAPAAHDIKTNRTWRHVV